MSSNLEMENGKFKCLTLHNQTDISVLLKALCDHLKNTDWPRIVNENCGTGKEKTRFHQKQ